jgi:hypothetical protein
MLHHQKLHKTQIFINSCLLMRQVFALLCGSLSRLNLKITIFLRRVKSHADEHPFTEKLIPWTRFVCHARRETSCFLGKCWGFIKAVCRERLVYPRRWLKIPFAEDSTITCGMKNTFYVRIESLWDRRYRLRFRMNWIINREGSRCILLLLLLTMLQSWSPTEKKNMKNFGNRVHHSSCLFLEMVILILLFLLALLPSPSFLR